ncbi:MAG TPA: phospholipase D-like domain-containing protein [Polyangiaceae bacterium]|nr:phospholipase D-like domain-containing protein [Polyangiaceae bacterium]
MRRILEPGNHWCELPAERVGLLIDGDDYYRAFYEAGQAAQDYLLLAGWQFDTDACLLRGAEAEGAPLPVTLARYLDALCDRRPSLRIYILAWDYHAVFALEREWLQDVRFRWLTGERVQFLFDAHHVSGGSHHQKFVVVDGRLAFLGGLDLCDHRWDDRQHRVPNPLRVSRGAPHQPFHDVQAFVVGAEPAGKLAELFSARWLAAGGAPLLLPPARDRAFDDFQPSGAVPLGASRIALSRVDPFGAPQGAADCREVFWLTLAAIRSAQRLLYLETQYFSSLELARALVERLRDVQGPPLELILVLNEHAETFKEEVAVGLAQAKVVKELRAAAAGTAHRLGIYYTVPMLEPGRVPERGTYIHSKLLIVDDRFLSVGSANWTNRSTYLDTELNLALEARSADEPLARSIAAARRSLLAEHLGVSGLNERESVVAALDELARGERARLRIHPSPTENERLVLDVIDPAQLPFDPAAPEAHADGSLFVAGFGTLLERLADQSR